MSGKVVDWVRIGGGGLMRCTRCGGTYKLGLPCPVQILSAVCLAFSEMHEHCEAQPETGESP